MSSPTRYKKGDYKAVCDVCGQRYLMSKLRKRWDGLMVCNKDYEPRQPQDFVRAKVDIQAVPVARPESTTYDYITINYTNSLSETITISEVVSVQRDGGITISESITISETSASSVNKSNSETVTLSETVVVYQIANKSLGTQVLGFSTLG